MIKTTVTKAEELPVSTSTHFLIKKKKKINIPALPPRIRPDQITLSKLELWPSAPRAALPSVPAAVPLAFSLFLLPLLRVPLPISFPLPLFLLLAFFFFSPKPTLIEALGFLTWDVDL